MDITTSFGSLSEMHPELEWNEIAGAAVAVLQDGGLESPFQVPVEVIKVPGFGSDLMRLAIDRTAIPATQVERIRRTYDVSRRVELAAIAVAALALYHGGGHEIVDVALHGSGADYVVDATRVLLEIAGRSRRADFEPAWRQKKDRFAMRAERNYYLCVVEFETPASRLTFVT